MAATSGTQVHPGLDLEELTQLKKDAAKALQQRRYDLAAGLFRRLMDADPADGAHAQRMGDAYVRLGCRRAAVEAYRSAAESYVRGGMLAKAVVALELVLALQPKDRAAREQISSLKMRQNIGVRGTTATGHDSVWDGEQLSDGSLFK